MSFYGEFDMKNKNNVCLFILVIVLVLTTCSQNIETEIIGSWKCTTPKQNIRFYQDGQVELNGLNHGVYKGIYEITDGNSLKCNFDCFANPVVRTVRIRGEKLILTDKNATEEIYICQH